MQILDNTINANNYLEADNDFDADNEGKFGSPVG